MNILWNLEKTDAIPVSNIKMLTINSTDNWSEKARQENEGIYKHFYVTASYVICTGGKLDIFTADTREECVDFINSLMTNSKTRVEILREILEMSVNVRAVGKSFGEFQEKICEMIKEAV